MRRQSSPTRLRLATPSRGRSSAELKSRAVTRGRRQVKRRFDQGFGGVVFLSAVTAWSISSSTPETPFLNSVTLFPSERITLGRRLPKIKRETKATMISSVGPRFGRNANGIMKRVLSSGRKPVPHRQRRSLECHQDPGFKLHSTISIVLPEPAAELRSRNDAVAAGDQRS